MNIMIMRMPIIKNDLSLICFTFEKKYKPFNINILNQKL
jgi:hypothetical protein